MFKSIELLSNIFNEYIYFKKIVPVLLSQKHLLKLFQNMYSKILRKTAMARIHVVIANCVNQICHTWLPHDKWILDQFVVSIRFWQRTVWNVHNKLYHVILYDIFVYYFGMISRNWDENILYFFNIEKKTVLDKKKVFSFILSANYHGIIPK